MCIFRVGTSLTFLTAKVIFLICVTVVLSAASMGWGFAVWDAKEPLKLSPKDWICFIWRSTRQKAQDDEKKELKNAKRKKTPTKQTNKKPPATE